MYLCTIWNITKRQAYDGNEAFNPDIFGNHHGGDLFRVRYRQMEGAAQSVAHPRKRAIGVGGRRRQCRGVVGDAGVAPQDPAQEVQVRGAGDICCAGDVGGVVAVGELGELSELSVFSPLARFLAQSDGNFAALKLKTIKYEHDHSFLESRHLKLYH